MDITPYVDTLRHDLAVAAEAGGDEARALADRLTAPLDASVRLLLLEVLVGAAEEISLELAPAAVEVRLRGRDPEFVVSGTESSREALGAATAPRVPTDEDGATARLNLRLPESLKQSIEAAASAEGLSLNAWLVRAAASALSGGHAPRAAAPATGQRFSGWAR
jgi:hypothetical protein